MPSQPQIAGWALRLFADIFAGDDTSPRTTRLGAASGLQDALRIESSFGYPPVRNAGVLLSGYCQDAGAGGSTFTAGARLWWAL